MNVRRAKKPEPRIETDYLSRLNMQTYGLDNLYPQNLLAITEASGTTMLCLDRYAKFIEGFGFENEAFAGYSINRDGDTTDTILHSVASDVAQFGGFALHVNYNVLCEITEINYIPFEHCRMEEEDDAGKVGHILVHPDWTGKKKRNGQHVYINEKTVSRIHVFNPDPDVVTAQVLAAGGIENYKGQVLYASMTGKMCYPTPIYDAIITDISTDEGLANIKNRNVRNNFLVACMLVVKKGVPAVSGQQEDSKFITDEDLKQFQGDTNGSKMLVVEVEDNEEVPEIKEFPVKNYDKEFSVTDQSVVERIYAQFHQEQFYQLRMGKTGFSADAGTQAYQYYAGEVTNEQRFIERIFTSIFVKWHDPLLRNANLQIQPLKYINSAQNG